MFIDYVTLFITNYTKTIFFAFFRYTYNFTLFLFLLHDFLHYGLYTAFQLITEQNSEFKNIF